MENNKLPNKYLVILFLGLVAGVAASFVAKQLMLKPKVKDSVAPQERVTQVLVAKSDLAPGDEVTALNVRFAPVRESEAPRDAIYTFADAVTRKVAGPIAHGAMLSLFDLEIQDEKTDAQIGFVPPGYSVVPVNIDSVTNGGASGDVSPSLNLTDFLKTGDQVSLSIVQEETSDSSASVGTTAPRKLVTKPLLDRVDVYRVSSELRSGIRGGSPRRYPVVSLLLSRQELLQLTAAMDSGRLRLSIPEAESLRSPEKQPGVPNGDASPVAANLLNGIGAFQLRQEEPASPSVTPVAQNDRFMTSFDRETTVMDTSAPVPETRAENREVAARPESDLTAPPVGNVKPTNWNLISSEEKAVEEVTGQEPAVPAIAPEKAVPESASEEDNVVPAKTLREEFRSRPTGSPASPAAVPVRLEKPVSPASAPQVPPVAVPRSGGALAFSSVIGINAPDEN